MKFSEAMKLLEEGKKITRSLWHGKMYFKKENDEFKPYQLQITAFQYTEDIMLSDGWIVDGKTHKFYEIISLLQEGKFAKLSTWNQGHIHYDRSHKYIVLSMMTPFTHYLTMDDMLADDWMEVE